MDGDTTLPRVTLYSPELAERICDLITDGKTIRQVCAEPGIPSRNTICKWLRKHDEFCKEYEIALWFRTQCLTDDAIDIADDADRDYETTKNEDGEPIVRAKPEMVARTRSRMTARYEQLKYMQQMQPKVHIWGGAGARVVGEEKVIEQDPVYGVILEWEIEARKRLEAKVAAQSTETR